MTLSISDHLRYFYLATNYKPCNSIVCMISRLPASSHNPLILQMRDAHTWLLPMTILRTQLKRQGWLNCQLPRHYSQPGISSTLLAAVSKPDANTEAVRAQFCEAGIADEVTTKVLRRYKPYLRWKPDTKLRPALQLWLKELGSQRLSQRLEKAPALLCRTPEECNDVYLWLGSLGVDAEMIQQIAPRVMARQLSEVQNTVGAIQQALQLPDEQLPAFFKQHVHSLLYLPERVAQVLQAMAEVLEVPLTSQEMQDHVMVCSQQIFQSDPAVLLQRVAFFAKEFKGGQRAAKAALKLGVYRISAAVMKERAAELKALLGWTEDELNQKLSACPRILTQKPSTVANNIQKLQAHNFSPAQALDMCASYPSMVSYDWDSRRNVEKLTYLLRILQLSIEELVIKPRLLIASLERKIGPRSEFLYLSRIFTPDMPLGVSGFLGYVQVCSDAGFAARFNKLSASPPLMFDEAFKQHWLLRWTFLTHEMGLSIADISACRALLFTSLPNTLGPRWHFLTLLEAAHADFKAADHLAALATLSDEHFALAFNKANVGLIYDKSFMQCAQGNL